ncbi:hypothetical protein WIW89_01100 [Stygiolobus sp. CP850M]|uniref:hypothetical protein n=1 Tax=Stygiolobus sp. CP850M TaxID=3133134 RepID=UPI00307E8169
MTKRIKLFLENNIKTGFFRKVHIRWYGGEPLLDFKTIIDTKDFTNSIAKMYIIDIVGEIITNGYLLDIVKFKILVRKRCKDISGDNRRL